MKKEKNDSNIIQFPKNQNKIDFEALDKYVDRIIQKNLEEASKINKKKK